MLSKIENMKLFVSLADSNAIAKLYKRNFGMEPSDVRVHTRFIPYYRLYIELADKVSALQKRRSNATTDKEKLEIRRQVRDLQIEYKPKIIKARSLR